PAGAGCPQRLARRGAGRAGGRLCAAGHLVRLFALSRAAGGAVRDRGGEDSGRPNPPGPPSPWGKGGESPNPPAPFPAREGGERPNPPTPFPKWKGEPVSFRLAVGRGGGRGKFACIGAMSRGAAVAVGAVFAEGAGAGGAGGGAVGLANYQ